MSTKSSWFLLCVSVFVLDGISSVPSPVVASNTSSSVLLGSVKQEWETSETELKVAT